MSRIHPRIALLTAAASILRPFVGNRLRVAALRAAGFSIGRGTIMWGMPTIMGAGPIATRLVIGSECGFNVGCFFELDAPVTIHNNVSVGHDVMFLTRTSTLGDAARRAGADVSAPIVVETGVWLAARCVVMPGVTIGAGSVIGAGSIVSEDVPANTLLLGQRRVSLAKWR